MALCLVSYHTALVSLWIVSIVKIRWILRRSTLTIKTVQNSSAFRWMLRRSDSIVELYKMHELVRFIVGMKRHWVTTALVTSQCLGWRCKAGHCRLYSSLHRNWFGRQAQSKEEKMFVVSRQQGSPVRPQSQTRGRALRGLSCQDGDKFGKSGHIGASFCDSNRGLRTSGENL